MVSCIYRQNSKFLKIIYIKDPLNQTEWTEDIMTKGTEYVKDKVTDEHIRGGNRGIGSWSVGKGTMGGQMDK